MSKYTLLLLPIISIIVTGCSDCRQDKYFVFKNSNGKAIASGTIDLPDTVPPFRSVFYGNWHVMSTNASEFPIESNGYGKYEAAVVSKSNELLVNFYPRESKSKVLLSIKCNNRAYSGEWFKASVGGGDTMGSFMTCSALESITK